MEISLPRGRYLPFADNPGLFNRKPKTENGIRQPQAPARAGIILDFRAQPPELLERKSK
jgi:hypothetical protein